MEQNIFTLDQQKEIAAALKELFELYDMTATSPREVAKDAVSQLAREFTELVLEHHKTERKLSRVAEVNIETGWLIEFFERIAQDDVLLAAGVTSDNIRASTSRTAA